MTVAKNSFLQNKETFELADIINTVNQSVYPNLYKHLQLAITIPVSSSTCERSFSTMRRVKTWLRTTMAEDRFSSLAMLNIERDLSNKIDTEVIVNKFAEQDRRIVLK